MRSASVARPLIKTLTAAALFAAVSVQAQVAVVESTPIGGQAATASESYVNDSTTPVTGEALPVNVSADRFYQLQLLQQEVLELRGLVEEQAHQLKRLKQQRTDDYLDLDRRISALGNGGAPSAASDSTLVAESGQSGSTTSPAVNNVAGSDVEAEAYRSAYDLLKQRQVDQAITAFSDLLIDHPEGKYAANAHYWLGEIFLLKNDLESARQWFTRLLDGFPGHRKVPGAQFKLGKVYHLLGDMEKSRVLLDSVAATRSDAARLAKKYIEQNFQ